MLKPANGNSKLQIIAVLDWKWKTAAGLALLLLLMFAFKKHARAAAVLTFEAQRGPLNITVLEGGSVEALQSQQVKSEVRGYQGTKILKLVEEGYLVTEDDVKKGKVLVELDSSELQKQITQQEIQFQSTEASFIEAKQAYEIQVNQNLSDIKAAEQKSRFAKMDLEKFLGDALAQNLVDQIGIEQILSSAASSSLPNSFPQPISSTHDLATAPLLIPTPNPLFAMASTNDLPSSIPLPGSNPPPKEPLIHYAKYAKLELLGDGEAKQKIRKLEDDLQLAQKEKFQAQTAVEGTRRLFDKGFVTKTDLDSDQFKFENAVLKVQTAQTAQSLFLKYEFPKSAEEFVSKYAEAVRELDRIRKGAISKLAQAEAKLKSAEGTYGVQLRQLRDLQDQLAKCVIRAQKTGLVVYGAGNNMFYGGEEQIREGAVVRERQQIITIPDMTQMSVEVKIHESYIKKIKKGQKATITIDAFPDEQLEGEVIKVGVLPDSQNRWMNPDLKVYRTSISIGGTHDWLKPGMSAKVEILVHKLADVVYVPIQAVSPSEGKQLCYVLRNGKQEARQVETGEFNDVFIEIKKGIQTGELVLLRAPEVNPEKLAPKEDVKPEKAESASVATAAQKP